MKTVTDLDVRLDAVDWGDPREHVIDAAAILRDLADNRELLSSLVHGVPDTPRLMARSEQHPVMTRLLLTEHPEARWCLRLHYFHGALRDLTPHTHKRPFVARTLTGNYLHAWHRRTDGREAGPFTSAELTPGIIAVENAGTGYGLGDPLIHQTIMEAGTATLFLSGPDGQPTWWAAEDDLNGGVQQMKQDDASGRSFPLTPEGHTTVARDLAERGIITARTELL
ncbi:hypothetical protein [Kitasatospora sp. NPDC056184]|uniref:hypothetical protein n=1 Tax=Kitasatospora sp. NPDC056184 TaxID=3345738 RepID=UPI0035DD373E